MPMKHFIIIALYSLLLLFFPSLLKAQQQVSQELNIRGELLYETSTIYNGISSDLDYTGKHLVLGSNLYTKVLWFDPSPRRWVLDTVIYSRITYGTAISSDAKTVAYTEANFDNKRGKVTIIRKIGGYWSQLGAPLLGDAVQHNFGRSIDLSTDGNTVAITTHPVNNTAADYGYAKVFNWDGAQWIQVGQTIHGNSTSNKLGFNCRLSKNGHRLLVNRGVYTDIYAYDNASLQWNKLGQSLLGNHADISEDGKRLVTAHFSSNTIMLYNWDSTFWRPSDTISFGNYGARARVALNDRGNKLVVAYPFANNNSSKLINYTIQKNRLSMLREITPTAGSAYMGEGLSLSGNGLIFTAAPGAFHNSNNNPYPMGTYYHSFSPAGTVSADNEIWLRTDVGTSNTQLQDGAPVLRWNDQSYLRDDGLAQNIATAPLYRKNGINYQPALDFDGLDDGLDLGADYITVNDRDDELTWFVVAQPDLTNNKPRQYLFDIGNNGDKGYGLGLSDDGLFMNARDIAPVDHNFTNNDKALPLLLRYTIDLGNHKSVALNGNATPLLLDNTAPNSLDLNDLNLNDISSGQSGPFTIGRQSQLDDQQLDNGRFFDGKIGEIIAFSGPIDRDDEQIIESYLGIKYGINLKSNYLNSAGSVIYDISNFKNDIIGLAIDKGTNLLQKQSQSIDKGERLYLDNLANDNASNTGLFNDNLQALLMGHNDAPLLDLGSSEYPANQSIYSRLQREYKVTNTNFDNDFSLQLKLDVNPNNININDLALLIDRDDDLSDASLQNAQMTFSADSILTISNISTNLLPKDLSSVFTIVSTNARSLLAQDYLQLKAKVGQAQTVDLKWISISRIPISHFEVERSPGGLGWEAIQTVESEHYTTEVQHLQITDASPLPGQAYYRIKQYTMEGDIRYSPMVSVHTDRKRTLTIYPNPTKQTLFIQQNKAYERLVRIQNSTGQVVLEREIPSYNVYPIDIQGLKNGVYTIQLISAKQHLTRIFIKQ